MGGDMEALARLRAAVQVGWRTDTVQGSSRYGRDGGAVITELSESLPYYDRAGYVEKLDKPERNQGRVYTTGTGLWPVEGDDFEVQERGMYDRPVWILHRFGIEYGSRVRKVSVEFKPGR
jgi:hypothetical protein